jgi:hypothetical protein
MFATLSDMFSGGKNLPRWESGDMMLSLSLGQ